MTTALQLCRAFLPALVTSKLLFGVCGVFVLLLFESSRSVCRTPLETARLLAKFTSTIVKTLVRYVARGCKPNFPKWTLRFELLRAIMRDASDTFGERIVDQHHAPIFRRHSELFGSFVGWFVRKQHSLRLETVQLKGLEHLWIKSIATDSADNTEDNSKRLVLLFYHGGGYAVLSPRMYISFGSALVAAVKRGLVNHSLLQDATVDMFLANYRKVPEFPFPTPVEDTVSMYEFLLQHEQLKPSQIILVGDSAGGGLVLSTLLRIRDGKSSWKAKLPLPLAAIVACPFADLTIDERTENLGQHCPLSGKMLVASVLSYHPTHQDSSTWADASPVQCDLTGLPPILLQAASLDFIFQHSMRLVAKAKADGVTNWEVDIHEGVPHVFMVFPEFVLPYAGVGIQRMAVFAINQFLRAAEEQHDISKTSHHIPGAA